MSRITFTAKLVNARVLEGSAFTLNASYFADDADTWVATAPTTAKYRIDRVNGDPSRFQEILAWTTLSAATNNAIAITGAQNAIQNDGAYLEQRQVTVMANAGLATQHQGTYRYAVENLAGQS